MFDEPAFHGKMHTLERRHEELSVLLGQAEIIAKRAEYAKLSREHSELSPLSAAWKRYKQLRSDLAAAKQMVETETDPELREMARDEGRALDGARELLEQEIKVLLLPKDPNDNKNVILEIRAGTGGDEAALFAGDLYRMYTRFAERQGWKVEVMSTSDGTAGGMKEMIALFEGKDVYAKLKFESGVHRVQRVPATEAQGRIHTSAATVAVMAEAEEVDIKIEDKDLRIDVYRSSGAGGQHVNKTESAVRIRHLPSGIVVACQSERSQHKNRSTAMKMLKAKLYELEVNKRNAAAKVLEDAKSDVSWGNQIRSYVLDQSRIKDLRTNVEISNTKSVLDGDLDEFIIASLKQGV